MRRTTKQHIPQQVTELLVRVAESVNATVASPIWGPWRGKLAILGDHTCYIERGMMGYLQASGSGWSGQVFPDAESLERLFIRHIVCIGARHASCRR